MVGNSILDFLSAQQPDMLPMDGMDYMQPQAPAMPGNDMVKQILSSRFQPTAQDTGNAALAGISNNSYVSPQSYVDTRMAGALHQMALMNAMQRTNIMASGGQTGAMVDRLLAANPNMSLSDAISFNKSPGQGVTFGANGVTPMPGAPAAAGAMSFGKKMGERNAEIGTAADIERQKITGEGKITPIEQQEKGQNQVDFMAAKTNETLDRLDQAGAAVNTGSGSLENFGAYVGNTSGGQLTGKMFGTANQSIRNEISQMRPLLINAIRQATGMSAKSMDSNAELQFYLNAVTDPTKDIQSQKVALQNLVRLYGGGAKNLPAQPVNITRPGEIAPPTPEEEAEYLRLKGGQ